MQLLISRLADIFQGFELCIKENDDIKTLAILNGNNPNRNIPIVLLELDQHIVYGMSHPRAISRILEEGPQQLITSKQLAHSLFEHGMKASLGKIKRKKNIFFTQLETFYTLTQETSSLKLKINNNVPAILVQPRDDYKPILVCSRNYVPNALEARLKTVIIDNIRSGFMSFYDFDHF